MSKVYVPKRKNIDVIRRWLVKYNHISTEELARRSRLSIKKITEWKVHCDVIDPDDEKLFKIWIQYKDYSPAEASIILGIPYWKFRSYLKKYDIKKHQHSTKSFCPKRKTNPTYPRIPIPQNRADFIRLLDKHGVRVISKMCGLRTIQVQRLKKKFGVESPRTSYKVYNNCNNREWLLENYIEKEHSLRKCAEMAGVSSPHTIRKWLIRHGIKPRSNAGI